jgi:hypothetical protein
MNTCPFFTVTSSFLAGFFLFQACAEGQSKLPATAVEAAAVLDLSTFPLVNPDGEKHNKQIASQSYIAKGSVLEVARNVREKLIAAGLKELEGAMLTDAYASGNYQKNGFSFSLTVMPGSTPGTVGVSITNFGNVDLQKLPKPEGVKLLYALPNMVAYVSEKGAEETADECRRLLVKEGWQPFGDTTASFFVKRNAVRLQVSVGEAPGQGGKTVMQLSSEQMSVDLPSFPEYEWLQYSDTTGGVLFDSRKSQAELVSYFKSELGKAMWQPTTENVVKIGFRDHLIFRNPKKEMIELQFYVVEGKTRCDFKYQTAAQVVEESRQADAFAAAQKAKREAEMELKKNPPKVVLPMVKGAVIVEQNPKSVEFSTESEEAQVLLAAWLKTLESVGWKKKVTVETKQVGEYTLTKDNVELSVSYVDPGFVAGSITLRVLGDRQIAFEK